MVQPTEKKATETQVAEADESQNNTIPTLEQETLTETLLRWVKEDGLATVRHAEMIRASQERVSGY